MRQQKELQHDFGNTPMPPKAIGKTVSDLSALTMGERRIIRNYRAMERIAQQTFEDISEEFARTLPAPGLQDLTTVLARG